jgi:anti-sigma B factor antagonist
MRIETQNTDKYIQLMPIGELDANSSLDMHRVIQQHLAAGNRRFVIDCSKLEYISSAGLGVFLSFTEELEKEAGKFIFCSLNPKVLDVFQLLGLDHVFTIVNSNQEANQIFQ